MSKRNSNVELLDVQNILKNYKLIAQSSLVQNESPTSPLLPSTSPSADRPVFQSHSRTMSTASPAVESSTPPTVRSNRFSVQFPIQPVRTASPVKHSKPSSPAPPSASSERPASRNHTRTKSTMTSAVDSSAPAVRSNRFSLSFPVQPSRTTSPKRVSQSPVREAPSVVPESLALLTGPSDSSFLTAIASQERRVLELKEELGRAEAELNKLKRQWAQHEAQRKRDDLKRLTKMQPLHTTLPSADAEEDSDGSSAWMQQEMERRKALLNSQQSSSRTVFSGSKHMRTLSLLTPVGGDSASTPTLPKTAIRPPRKDSISATTRRSNEIARDRIKPPPLHRAVTTPEIVPETVPEITPEGESTIQPEVVDSTSVEGNVDIDKDLLLKTGKKMATDLRDGLWTFWEDIRQAAVGEEATKIEPPARRQTTTSNSRLQKKLSSRNLGHRASQESLTSGKSSTDTKRPAPKHSKSATVSLATAPALADPSFWTDHGIPADQQATPAKVKKVNPGVRHAKSISKVSSVASSDNEAWDTWDENSPQSHGSRASSAASDSNTVPTTASETASPRTSSEVVKDADGRPISISKSPPGSGKKDPIPWPALSNLGPKALKRTASHLMAEWEKSLTPSPVKEDVDHDDYLGLGAEAAAVLVPAERKAG